MARRGRTWCGADVIVEHEIVDLLMEFIDLPVLEGFITPQPTPQRVLGP
jgi:hypothetical protein